MNEQEKKKDELKIRTFCFLFLLPLFFFVVVVFYCFALFCKMVLAFHSSFYLLFFNNHVQKREKLRKKERES